MKRLLTLLLASAALLPSMAWAQSDPSRPQPALVVQGQGVVSRTPDTASVSVGIESSDPSATAAQSKNNSAYARMLAALDRTGVPRSSVQYTGYDLRYVPPPEPTPAPMPMSSTQRHTMPVLRNPHPGERYGYVVSRSVTISNLDPARVGAVVDACAGAGATSIDGVAFGIRDRRGAYDAALAAALQDADRQARTIAAAGHLRIVRIERIEAGAAVLPGPVAFARAATADGTQITPPAGVETRANITVTYAIASAA